MDAHVITPTGEKNRLPRSDRGKYAFHFKSQFHFVIYPLFYLTGVGHCTVDQFSISTKRHLSRRSQVRHLIPFLGAKNSSQKKGDFDVFLQFPCYHLNCCCRSRLPHGKGFMVYYTDDADGRYNYTGLWEKAKPHGEGK